MDQSDRSHSPSRNFFDPTNLLGSSPFSPAAAAANPYAHLAHLPSAFSMMGHPGFPGAPPFGGLGSLDPLRSQGSVLSPTTGGADWWRAASDHARRTAGFGDVDFLVGTPTVGLPGQQQVTSGDNGAVYRPLEDSKHLNGAYQSLFGLPTYTSASASTTTKSSTSQDSKHSKSSKSDLSAASTPLSPPGKRSASPASSTTSSHSSSSRAKEGGSSKGGKHRDSGADKTKNGPGAAAMSISKYDEEVAKSLSSMFAFPDATAGMLGPSMFSAPPMFSYPYGAGALFAAHHASLFGMPMVGHPSMPFSMGMSLPSSVSTSHSTTSSSRGGTKTTSSTTTTPSSAVSKSASSTPRTPSSSSKQGADSKSRKNLFGEHHSGTRPDGGLSSPPAAPHRDSHHHDSHHSHNKQQPRDQTREQTKPLQLTNHSSPRVRGASSDSDSLPDVSSDSLSDDSDLENDRSSPRAHRKNKKMPRLSKMPELSPAGRMVEDERAARPSPDLNRPPTPDLVQDLSMKKRPASVSSHTSSSSHPESSSRKKDSHSTASSSTSSSSSSKKPPPLISTPTSYPMSLPMHSSFADMTAQHMESLFGAGHMPPKLPMYFHPAAAMMAPMLDGSMSLLLPPPPSSAQAAAAASSGRRGRGRGRGSRSGGSANNSTSTSSTQGTRKGRGGRGRGGNSRSRTASTSSSSSAAGMDYAALSQLQEEHHQAALREHMELQLKAHHQMAALGMMQDPHQMAALQRAQDSQKEATNKLHQLADKHASRNSDEKSSKGQSSKLSNALMGQLPTASSLPKSYPPSKHSEGPTDSDMEDLESSEAISASSSSESESEDSDVDAQSSQESETQGSKRPGEESDSATPRKRRRMHEIDETEIRIPLEHGWRRQTRLRGIGSRGLIGEVVYFAPCGKKLKTVPDVARYLEKNSITDLVRANFTFSTKVNVGDFLEARSEDGMSGYVALTEEEVVERFMLIATQKRAKLVAKQERAERRKVRKLQSAEMAQRMAEMKMAKKHEQQEMTRRIAEMKMRRKLERQQAREAARRDKQMKADEIKKMKEQERIMRQQEKVQRQEQMRIEREMRAQQIMEEKQRRKDELQRRLYEDALEKAKDREMKRQQQVMLKEQDRERRRQHMLLVKALEARKRYEERERAKEEKIKEKIMERDRKMEQRRIEMEMAREMQKPVEDMLLNNHQELPTLERIPGQCLAGEAFADCLMVIEFLHNFGTVLGFDDESLPTIQELHAALLNDEDEVEELVTVFTHILKFAIDDPGFPNPKEAVTASGLKIADLEVTEENMSELLRVFVRARNGKDDEMTDWLLDKPLLALTPTQKAACLAFLCNELLSSKSVYGEIEKNIETLSNLRKDKWMAEGKVRKLRMMQAKKLRAETKAAEAGSEAAGSKKGSDDEDDGKEQDDDNESGNESDVTNATGNVSDEDEEMSLEELEKKIEKVNKQQNTNDRKGVECVNRLRATDVGQDRYKRRYWVLPKAGGMFIEGLESAEIDEEQEEDDSDAEADDSKKEEVDEVDDEDDGVKDETKPNEAEEAPATPEKKANEGENKVVNGVNKVDASPNIKEETADIKGDSNDVQMKEESESSKDKDENAKVAISATVKKSTTEIVDHAPEEQLVNGVKEEVHDETTTGTNEKKGLLDTIHSKVEQLSQLEELETTCVKVELNGKRTDEAMVVENGEVKAENGLDHHHHHKRKPALCEGIKEEDDVEMKAPCEMNGSREVEEANDFKVPNAASLLAKAEGISKLHDVLGSPPALHRSAQSLFTTPPPSSLDIFKPTQNNNYCIPNSHAEIASSFRSIDSILGSADHKSTPPSSSAACSTPVAGMATPTSTSTSPVFNSSFLSPHDVLSSTPVSAEQMLKTLSQQGTPDTWFSILPRMPCDESSITRCSPSQAAGTPGGVTGTPVGNSSYASPSHCSMYSTPGGYPSSHRGSPIDFHYYDRSMCNTPSMQDSLLHFGEMVDKHVHTKPKPIPKALQRGWWRITNTEQLQTVLKCMHTRGVRERCLQQGLEKYIEGGTQNADFAKDLIKIEETDAYKEIVGSKTGVPEPDARCGWSEEECTKAEAAALEEVEDLEERVFGASLQVKGCTLPHKVSDDDETATRPKRDEEDEDDDQEPLERARQHLLQLEKNIERRYIKPPLAKGVQINLANLSGNTSLPHDDSDGDEEEEDLPAALLRWRQAVLKAVSAAQLHLCVHQLNKCIAWEKSIMKVSCQICCKDDNEAELLLCDSCDKGYHTYCFRPKMEDIPDGDWYCCACISKATGEPTCVVCCKKGPKIASCDHCSYAMHIECMDPPLPRVPRRYTCYTCSLTKNKGKKRTRKPSTKVPPKVTVKETKTVEKSPTKNEPDTSQTEQATPEKEKKGKKKQQQATPPPPPPPPQPQPQQPSQQQQQKAQQQQQKQDDKETNKKEEKEKESKKTEKKPDKRKGDKSSLRESSRNADKTDLTPCRTLLAELERHEEAWPFLQPVNHKQFPSYRKVIKHAMDVPCLKHKLRDSVYKLRDEFAADVRLMFNNCQLFNEDESEVGQAGFILRSFFEKRWRELGCS